MARPIDEKIVAMKMDNSDFKQKAVETTGLFGKLRDALAKVPGVDMSRVTKSFGDIQSAANKIDMTTLATNVDNIANRFTNLGVIATTSLMNITNRAVDAGLALAHSLTTAPVGDGFREYEQKMGSIQTMLSNTEWEGSTLDDVKRVLGQLNSYADQTIYDFGQMTSSIGTWTAAGVGLEDSAIAIKGLGNLAAVSGSDVQQLNTAMYQMSQGMAAGKFGAIDWISMTNAGMGGKKTQDALLATAKAMGKNIDMSDGFKGSLEQGWLTADVFLETMKQFGNDESMTKAATSVRTFTGMIASLKEGIGSSWAETWELIFGDFEVATERWTALSEVIGGFFQRSGDARNKFIKALAETGAFQLMFDAFTKTGATVLKIFDAIGGGIKKAFAWVNLEGIVGLAKSFKDFAISLKPSEATLNNISTIFQAVFSVISAGIIIIVRVGKALIDMIPPDLGSKVISVLAFFARLVISFTEAITSGKEMKSSFGGLSDIFSKLGEGVSGLVKMFTDFGDKVSEVWKILSTGETSVKGPWDDNSKIVNWLQNVRDAFKSVGDYLGSLEFSLAPITNGFKNFFGAIRDGFNWVKEKISDFGQAIKDAMPEGTTLVAGGFLTGLLAIVGFIAKMGWDLWQIFKGWGEIGSGVTDVLESVSGALNAFTASVYVNALLTLAIAIGVLAVGLKILSTIDGDKVGTSLYALVGILSALIGGMAILTKYDITGTGMSVALQMIALGIAVMIMAGALKMLSGLSPSEITKSLYALIGIMGTLTLAVTLMSKYGGGKIGASALQMVALAAAVHILVSAIQRIADIKTGELKKGLTTIGIVLAELALFLILTKKSTFGPGSALGILGIAAALHIITGAIAIIGNMDVGTLKQGLVVIGAILVVVAAFSQITSGTGLLATGAGLLLLSVALNALLIPIATLGNMELKTLATGVGAIAIALVAIGLASKLMVGAVAAGAGLILLSIGLNMLIVPIKALAAMGWGAIATGVFGLAMGLLVIGGVSALLGLASSSIMAFSVAILILGAGLALGGIGITLFGTALVTLAGLTAGAVTAIVAGFATMIMGFSSLIPMAVNFIWSIIQQMATALVINAPILANKLLDGLLAMLKVVYDHIPDFVTAATKIITSFLDSLSENLPAIVDSATNLMITFIESLAAAVEANGPRFTTAVMSLMQEVLLIIVEVGIAVIQALFGWIPGVTEATNAIGTSAEETIRTALDAQGVGEEKGEDFAGGIDSKTGDAEAAGENVASSAETGADSANLTPIGTDKGLDFATAMSNTSGNATTAGTIIANAGKNGAGTVSMGTTGTNFGLGFAGGISGAMDKVVTAAKNLAMAAKNKVEEWLDMHSPSREMIKDGGHFGEGFAIGIANKVKSVAASAKSLAVTAKDSLNQFIEGFELPEEDNELQFKAVINYDSFDASRFGNITPMSIRPNTSLTNGLITATKADLRQNDYKTASVNNEQKDNKEQVAKQPAVIQVVTPEKRELAKWLVEDITEFQNFKLSRATQF